MLADSTLLRCLRVSVRIPAFFAVAMWHSALIVLESRGYLRVTQDKGRPSATGNTSYRAEVIHRRFLKFISNAHRLMGIRVDWRGEIPTGSSVFMGNHRSYVDAILMPAKNPIVFVARLETKKWPIIGWGATVLGTIWVNRKDPDSRKATRVAVRDRLDHGQGICIFPEGTTHIGPELKPYHPGMFYLCVDGGFPITPVAIEYADPKIAWVNKEWFIPHALRHFGKRHLDVIVEFGPTQMFTEGELARTTIRNWTENTVLRLRKELDT